MTKKPLNKILEGYLDDYMTQDTQKFIKSHTVMTPKGDEKTGTSDDKLFKASNIKQTAVGGAKKVHGYKSPEDEKAYDPQVETPALPKAVKEENNKHDEDCDCEDCEDMKEEVESSKKDEDDHFEKQSKKMQDAINLHLRRGKNYKEAVSAAKKHVKEEADQIDEISNRAKSAYLGTAVADLTARSQEHGYNVGKKKKDLGDNPRKIMNRQDGIYRATKGMREESELAEKTLTPAEMKKREEIARAIERKNPGMAMSKKMAIATAAAKRVAEAADDFRASQSSTPATKSVTASKPSVGGTSASGGSTSAAQSVLSSIAKTRMKEEAELEEAKRGRPSKSNPEQNIEPIQTQLQKMHKQHEVDVTFADKSTHTIPREHASKALQHLASLKPIHRDEAQKMMSSSKQGFYDALAGKKAEKKPRVSLAPIKSMKESTASYELAQQKQMINRITPKDRETLSKVGAMLDKERKSKVTLSKLGDMGITKKVAPPSDEAREKKAGGGDD